jgi:hypothetical protein
VRGLVAARRHVCGREAQEPIAGGRERVRLLAVPLERTPTAMERIAVELDDETACGPERVDLVAVEVAVRLRSSNSMSTEEAEEAPLELGAGGLTGRGAEGSERLPQPSVRVAVAATRAPKGTLDRVEIEPVEPIGLRQALGELVRSQDLGEIHEGPSDRGDRDGIDERDVLGIERAAAERTNPRLVRARSRRRDVDARRVRRPDPV